MVSWRFLTAAAAALAVSCGDGTGPAPTEGSIEVSVATDGDDLPTSYRISVDDANTRSIGANDTVIFRDLLPGTHIVRLDEIPANCTITSSHPVSVSVRANSTALAAIDVTCVALTSTLRLISSTRGVDLDSDGYLLTLDGADWDIGINDTLIFPAILRGSHDLELQMSSVAANCLFGGDTIQSPFVIGDTFDVALDFFCQTTSGRTGQFAYVGVWGEDRIEMIETLRFTTVTSIDVESGVWGMTVSPDGSFAYAGLTPGVAVIEASTGTLVTVVPAGDSHIRNVAVAPDASAVYAVDRASGRLYVIETTGHTVVDSVLDAGNEDVAITPDGSLAYVVGQNGLSVIDISTLTIIRSVDAGPSEGIALTPDGQFAYLAQPGQVAVLELGSDMLVATIPFSFDPVDPPRNTFGQADIAVTPDGASAYRSVTCCARVGEFATATNTLVSSFEVPANPSGVAMSPDGILVYVLSPPANRLTVIERATNTEIISVVVGDIPINIAITPF